MQPERRAALNADLIRLADGDRSAASCVFETLWPVVRAFTARALGDGAEDAAQQALVKLFEQASAFDRTKDALSWALEIAAWEIRTELKRRSRSREAGWDAGAELVPAGGPLPDGHAESDELRAGLEAAMGTLSPMDRETLAAVLAENEAGGATWRKRKERAITRLRAAWRGMHGD